MRRLGIWFRFREELLYRVGLMLPMTSNRRHQVYRSMDGVHRRAARMQTATMRTRAATRGAGRIEHPSRVWCDVCDIEMRAEDTVTGRAMIHSEYCRGRYDAG
jgi:hypothetical protein